jgi:FMN-dependent NADH-azoreductase
MRLLHVDTSPRGEISKSRSLSRGFVEKMRLQSPDLIVDYLDLAQDSPPHVTAEFITATYTPADERTSQMRAGLAQSDALCARILSADFIVFSMPMYNFSMPSTFKAFIDAIVRTNVTYTVEPDGRYVGQLGAKKVLFITTRGVDFRAGSPLEHMDGLTPALRAAFGFIGVSEPTFVDAQPVQFAQPEQCAEAMERARGELEVLASRWADDHASYDETAPALSQA